MAMNDNDLKDMGLNKGARLDLLNAIKTLNNSFRPSDSSENEDDLFGRKSPSSISGISTHTLRSNNHSQESDSHQSFLLGQPQPIEISTSGGFVTTGRDQIQHSSSPCVPSLAIQPQQQRPIMVFRNRPLSSAGSSQRETPAPLNGKTPSCSKNIPSTPSQPQLAPVSSGLHGPSPSVQSSSQISSQRVNSNGLANQEISSCSQNAPFPLPQQSLSRVTLRRELDGQLSSVQNSSQRVNSDGPSNQEVAGSSQNRSSRNGERTNLRSLPQSVGRSPLLSLNQNVARTSGAERVPPAQSADTAERELRSSTVANLNSEERIGKILDKAAKGLHAKYDFVDILPKYRGGAEILDILQKEGVVLEAKKKVLSRILVSFMRDEPVANLSEVEMRHEMAIHLAIEYPKMRKRLLKRTDMPWHHWFNAETNTGFLENSNVGLQRSDKKLTGRGIRRSKKNPRQPRKLVEIPTNSVETQADDPDPIEFTRNVTEARNLFDTPGEKTNILNLMHMTFERRRTKIEFKELTAAFILNQYPHFMSYEGELIEQEFSLMEPSHSRLFVRSFDTDWVPKLMKIARDAPEKYHGCEYFGADDVLNSLLVLRKLLPTPRRTYTHEARQPIHGDISDIVLIVPMGTDPKVEAEKHISDANYPVQPFLMVQGRPGEFLGQKFIVCGNGSIVSLPRQIRSVKAIDLLFKTYFALYLHYPLGWKNVFRFLQVHLFDIPLDNPRESTFESALMILNNTNIE